MKKALSVFFALMVCFMMIIPANAATFPLNSYSLTLFKGEKATLEIEGVDSQRVTWRSSNKAIATVTKKGIVTARKAGTAVVTGNCNGISFKCKVTVQNVKKLNKLLYSGEFGKLYLKEINGKGLILKYYNRTDMDIWLDSEYFVIDGKQFEDENDVLPGTDYWVVFNELDMIVPEGMSREGIVYLRNPSVKMKKISGYIKVMEKRNDGGYDIGKILIKNIKL